MDTTSRWTLRVTNTTQGRQFTLDGEGTPHTLTGRMGSSLEARLDLLRQQLGPQLAARRAEGKRLQLVVPDESLQLALALASIAPGGWDDVTLASQVKCTDERGPVSVPGKETKAPAPPREPPPPTYERALYELQRAASWYGRQAQKTQEAQALVLSFPEARADDGAAAQRAIRQGEQLSEELDKLNVLARKYGAEAPETRVALEQAVRRVTWWTGFRKKALSTLQQADAARARRLAQRVGGPASTVRPGAIDHRIHLLRPSSRWTLLIDEAGAIPEDGSAPTSLPRGRFVGLLVPEPTPLPPLKPGWHAVAQRDPRAIDAVVQDVLDAPVGVLGLELDALPPSRGDRWVTGVLDLIHWVCRLLPLEGAAHLTVLIEQRGEYVADTSWKATATELLRHLTEQEPDRFRQLSLDLRLIRKSDSVLNGYVDALAFTWASTSGASVARLKQSGLREGCLHSAQARVLRESWEASSGGKRLSGEQWRALVQQPDAEVSGSIPYLLLSRVRESCLQSPLYWQALLDSVRAHLDSKAVRLRELGREVAFLASCMPQGHSLKPLLRLAWLTARLERANHAGEVDNALEQELEALGSRLRDEAPVLVCQADLDRAVLATNRFDFRAATRALARWTDVAPAVPGLQHYGRIQSSLGQHAAFTGLYAEAEQLFLSALQAFSLLSDEDVARAEQRHTATYLAIATLDTPGASPERIRERVSAIVPLSTDSIRRVAHSSAVSEKFAHHLLLRFLVSHGTPEERRAYLDEREGWRTGEGHPWPLIELYRGLLHHQAGEIPESETRLLSGVELALAGEQGPTLSFIGLTIGLVGTQLGLAIHWPRPEVEALRRALPQAPWSTVTAALEGRWERGPLALLESCLPFNFR
ncbi:hypothetical protein [Archangium primigenium]|uniref:hypothetical protein n=1 Tax=[Archangium] primigenium TaxID=2792470 RepID=UPI0019595E01|nr:hypothetical protein [Archangium primigenium]MBM7115741.1 hypothetical protein [Archangium primigenium]